MTPFAMRSCAADSALVDDDASEEERQALAMAADALRQVIAEHGNEAIFGSSLWLGERRSFSPFAEPAASLSQSARRLHVLRPVVFH
jgi:hypothetical protein